MEEIKLLGLGNSIKYFEKLDNAFYAVQMYKVEHQLPNCVYCFAGYLYPKFDFFEEGLNLRHLLFLHEMVEGILVEVQYDTMTIRISFCIEVFLVAAP